MLIEMGAMSILDVLAAASEKAKPAPATSDESRFPVVVKGDTRAYLDAQCAALGVSLAGLCGTILDEVVMESKRHARLRERREPT